LSMPSDMRIALHFGRKVILLPQVGEKERVADIMWKMLREVDTESSCDG
jgi:hypothetical protein